MSGPANIGDNIYTEFDICYISSFYHKEIRYNSVYNFAEKNSFTDTEISLYLKGNLLKFENDVNLINILINTENKIIQFPYNNSKINYALILRAIRAYFQGKENDYYNILSELGC